MLNNQAGYTAIHKLINASDNPWLVERNIMASTNQYAFLRRRAATNHSLFDGKVLLIVTLQPVGYEDLGRNLLQR